MYEDFMEMTRIVLPWVWLIRLHCARPVVKYLLEAGCMAVPEIGLDWTWFGLLDTGYL